MIKILSDLYLNIYLILKTPLLINYLNDNY